MFRIDRTLVNIEPIEATITNRVEKESDQKSQSEGKPDAESEKRYTANANELIAHATQRAEILLQEAEEQALLIKRLARQKGYEEGINEAALKLEKALEEIREEDRAMGEDVVRKFQQARTELLDGIEEEIVGLSLAIVTKIFGQSNKDSSMLESMILNALKQTKKEGKAIVHVSKEEYDRFFSSGSASFVFDNSDISVVPDDELNCGDCLIESEGEWIDAGFDCQLRNIQAAFKQANGVSV